MTLIVISDGFDAEQFKDLQEISEFSVHPKPKLSQEELETLLPNLEGLVVRSATTVNKDLIDKAPKLKYVIRAGAGTDNIDKNYCQEKGVKVSNTPGANSNAACEQAISLMITLLRKTTWAHESMKKGEWNKGSFLGLELTGKTIGIVGFGKIGKLLMKRLSGFDPNFLIYDPYHKVEEGENFKFVSTLKEIFENSDIITVHVPLTPETKGVINKTLLSIMKKDAVLINAARGGVVDESDLYNALKEGTIRGAGLDVFESEPLEEKSPLRELSNIVLTPHLGGSTKEAQENIGKMVVHQLKEFYLNKNLLNEVKA